MTIPTQFISWKTEIQTRLSQIYDKWVHLNSMVPLQVVDADGLQIFSGS